MDDDLRNLFGDAGATNVPERVEEAQAAKEANGIEEAEAESDEEAAARLAIERVLSDLRHPGSCARVLRWAIVRFGGDLSAGRSAGPEAAVEAVASDVERDPTLSVDDLNDLFGPAGDLGKLRNHDK